jgi:glutaminase
VGVEPTGEAFNSIVLDEVANRPFNPMVNAGAIAVAELMDGTSPEERIANMLALFGGLAGKQVEIDEAVFLSEQATGHRNRAIAYMMLNTGMIKHDPNEVLDLYFRQCSVNVTTRDLAVMAATLANDGTNPVTGKRVFEAQYVRDVLSVMNSCGMYDYAGEWAYEVGMPAKSGRLGLHHRRHSEADRHRRIRAAHRLARQQRARDSRLPGNLEGVRAPRLQQSHQCQKRDQARISRRRGALEPPANA